MACAIGITRLSKSRAVARNFARAKSGPIFIESTRALPGGTIRATSCDPRVVASKATEFSVTGVEGKHRLGGDGDKQ